MSGDFMLKKIIFFGLIILFYIISINKAEAVGFGLYTITGGGSSDFTFDYDSYAAEISDLTERSTLYSTFGFGFVLDSRVSLKGIFNYRLNLGYENTTYTADILTKIKPWEDNFFAFGNTNQIDFTRISIDNTFGFGVFSNRFIRLWLGPSLRLLFETASTKSDYYGGGLGIGAILGVNWNIGKLVSICGETGYRYSGNFGGYNRFYSSGSNEFEETIPYSHTDSEFFGKFSFIFRIDDSFSKK